MERNNVADAQNNNSKKRRVLPSEIANRFRSKSDFLKYFKEQSKWAIFCVSVLLVQLYTPPELMVNKDFLRQILSGDKELLPLNTIKFVNVPAFDELSVRNLWPTA